MSYNFHCKIFEENAFLCLLFESSSLQVDNFDKFTESVKWLSNTKTICNLNSHKSIYKLNVKILVIFLVKSTVSQINNVAKMLLKWTWHRLQFSRNHRAKHNNACMTMASSEKTLHSQYYSPGMANNIPGE